MKHYYFASLLLAAAPALAQNPAPAPLQTDTVRLPFRGTLPDSLAAAPTPGGTFRLQGQDQPARPFLTVLDQLRTVAGVQATPYDGSPGSGGVVRVRGASVAQGLAQPLYVVDGLPALNDELAPGGALGLLGVMSPRVLLGSNYNHTTVAEQHAEAGASPLQLLPPEAIESIEVLAGPAAVARYGPLGANGVISIRTRRGRADRPLHLRYAAYVGVQQVRQRYDLLPANEYAEVANEAYRRQTNGAAPVPFANTNLGVGTDWQAETYRTALLHQHQLTLDGTRANTSYVLGFDYRQQAGVLPNADLTRLGLRLGLHQRLGSRLQLHGTATLGQTEQRLPNTLDAGGVVRTALTAPPTQGVRTAQGTYSGYDYSAPRVGPTMPFTNPLAVAEYTYRAPRTRRLLAQLGADYQLLPHLTVQASANFQRTLLSADSYMPPLNYSSASGAPAGSVAYATQVYRTSQWAMQAAVRYQRALGTRHRIGAEVDYQYQGSNFEARNDFYSGDRNSPFGPYTYGYYAQGGELRFHRPWAHVEYSFDSTLTLEAGLTYGHYKGADKTEYYPSAQLSWQTHPGQADVRLWAGAARTSTLVMGYNFFGPQLVLIPVGPTVPGYSAPERRYQTPLYNDQLEAGLRLGTPSGRLTAQLVAYQRTSYHALLSQTFNITQSTGYATIVAFDEATIRNQGLELTLTATWQRGRLQGSSRLVASLNRNRLREAEGPAAFSPMYNNEPTGVLYGYQQDGLNADGTLRFRRDPGSVGFAPGVLGTGIPPQLVGFSQQLRQGRWALDAQVDGMFGYQVLNYQRQLLDTPNGYTNNATTVRDRWTPANPNTNIPAAGAPLTQPFSPDGVPITTRLVEDGAHLRLSSLTLTYRLRQTATQDLSVWVGGQNLFVLTTYQGYDPNVSSGGATPTAAGLDYGAVPVPRTWLLGVALGI